MKAVALAKSLRRKRRRSRTGAMLSMELVLVLPIVLGLIFAAIEIGLLWSTSQRVHEAAAAGCRAACFRGADTNAVRRAIEFNLGRQTLISNYALDIRQPDPIGNEVCVTVSVPMIVAAPDLLCFLGFSLNGRTLTAQSVMRHE